MAGRERRDSAVLLHLCRGLHSVCADLGIETVYATVDEAPGLAPAKRPARQVLHFAHR